MPVPISGYSHVRLTVTDLERSRAFYDLLLGLPVAFEVPDDADDATRDALSFLFGGIIYALPGGALLGLRPVAAEGDRFDPDRVGLDHLSFAVADEAVLTDAATMLDEAGIAHEPVKDLGRAWILEVKDPDGVALELYATKA